MRAIFIDSVNQIIKEVELNSSLDYEQYIGRIEIATELDVPGELGRADTIYVSEDGIAESEQMGGYGISVKDAHQPFFFGDGLVMGTDWTTGKTVDAKISISELNKIIKFKNISKFRMSIP